MVVPRRLLRLPLIAALALAFVSLALISGVAYIAVLTGATGTAERLLVEDEPQRHARLALALAVRQVLRNGLSILGVSAPDSM